jgi:hypothetical protein
MKHTGIFVISKPDNFENYLSKYSTYSEIRRSGHQTIYSSFTISGHCHNPAAFYCFIDRFAR